MSAEIVDLMRYRFTHERSPARQVSAREQYLRALSRQRAKREALDLPADEAARHIEDAGLLDRMIGAPDPFTGGGDAA